MSGSIINIIKDVQDGDLARLVIINSSGEKKYLEAAYKEDKPPMFFLAFPPGVIPDQLEVGKKCSISIKNIKHPLIITASIEEIVSRRSIYFKALKVIDPATLREYFRVDMNTIVKASYQPKENSSKRLEFSGKTIDVSGSGVLAVFDEEPPDRNNITLELYLEYYKTFISCEASVVRTRKIRKNKYRTAFHIERITSKNRDKIITSCLHEQRKILRKRMAE